ncbi:hypothetical protein ACNQGA_14755, partial [Flavobacterium sp. LB3R33]
MKTFLLKSHFFTFIFLLSSLLFASASFGQATVSTDLLDYPPGATAIITGSGFLAGEYVELHVHHSDGDPLGTDPQHHLPWFVTADANGDFTTSWYVPTVEEGDALGATFNLEAHGNMGSEAEWTFTDGNTVTFNSPTQSGIVNTGVGGSVTYSFTVTRDGAGNTFTSTFSTSGLPTGVTPVFSPSSFSFSPGASLSLNLTLTVASSVPAGTYTFTVTGSNGDPRNLTLIVSGCTTPTINATNLGPVNNAAGLCGASVALGSNITTTGTPTPTVTYSLTNFGTTISNPYIFHVGTTTVWAKSSNSCGDAITSFTVTVTDTQKPTVVTQNITVQLNSSGAATITPSQINNGSTDNCSIASYSLDITSFDCSKVGSNTVTLTVTDVNGNSDSKTATVTVEDTVKPTVVTQNITVQLNSSGTASVTAAQVNNASTDNCAVVSWTLDKTDFTCANAG